jgi:hypothetical protein
VENGVEASGETRTGELPCMLGRAVADVQQIHPLLQNSAQDTIHSDGPDDIRLRQSAPPDTTSLDEPDAELAPVLEQLQRSLENMQGNHAHVEGISGAMRDAQAALDDVMFRHAGAQHYAAL